MSLLSPAPTANRNPVLHGRGPAGWTTISYHHHEAPCTRKICSGCAVGTPRPCITDIPTAFSLLFPVSSVGCFTWWSHRISHETGLSSHVPVLASIPERQTAGGNCWSIFAAMTYPAQQGCSVLAAHFLLILRLPGWGWWGLVAGKKQ